MDDPRRLRVPVGLAGVFPATRQPLGSSPAEHLGKPDRILEDTITVSHGGNLNPGLRCAAIVLLCVYVFMYVMVDLSHTYSGTVV